MSSQPGSGPFASLALYVMSSVMYMSSDDPMVRLPSRTPLTCTVPVTNTTPLMDEIATSVHVDPPIGR